MSAARSFLIALVLGITAFMRGPAAGAPEETNSLKRTMYRVQAGVPDADGWCQAESTGGHFKVRLPGCFNDFEVSGIDEFGKKQENYTVGMITADNTKFSVTLAVKDPAAEKEVFDKFLSAFKKNGTLQSSRRIKILGHTVLEAEMGDNNRSASMRMMVAKNGVYLLIAECDSNRKGALKNQIKMFLDSFELPSGGSRSKNN